ncbi:MAG: tryptophan halogenase family protein [Marinagarivorans sp.]
MRKRNLVIVGGGTAGWMCAAACANQFHPAEINISLIESDAIGTVGVGEATIPLLRHFNQRLGVNEREFVRATHATYKLGIEFKNWSKMPGQYIHPFGDFGNPIEGYDFYWAWMQHKYNRPNADFGSCSTAVIAARNGRFTFPKPDWLDWRGFNYAFHLDAVKYAQFLRSYAEAREVVRIEGVIKHVEQAENGDVSKLHLEDGRVIAGDIFIDCSGFRSLLLGGALKEEFEDWSHWLLCDRAIAIPSKSDEVYKPYTQAEAMQSGWRWEIPLVNRSGNGLVYCSGMLNDDEACGYLQRSISTEAIGQPNFIKFKAGRRKRSWVGNCLAIGLSSGFLEPLESTSIYLIQLAIMKFLEFYSPEGDSKFSRNEFDRIMGLEYERVRDFIIAHYYTAQRTDSPFWQYCSNMNLPDSLQERLEIFKRTGAIDSYEIGLFQTPSWAAMLIGQHYTPSSRPLHHTGIEPLIADKVRECEKSIAELVEAMPFHKDFLMTLDGVSQAPPSGLNFYGVFC